MREAQRARTAARPIPSALSMRSPPRSDCRSATFRFQRGSCSSLNRRTRLAARLRATLASRRARRAAALARCPNPGVRSAQRAYSRADSSNRRELVQTRGSHDSRSMRCDGHGGAQRDALRTVIALDRSTPRPTRGKRGTQRCLLGCRFSASRLALRALRFRGFAAHAVRAPAARARCIERSATRTRTSRLRECSSTRRWHGAAGSSPALRDTREVRLREPLAIAVAIRRYRESGAARAPRYRTT